MSNNIDILSPVKEALAWYFKETSLFTKVCYTSVVGIICFVSNAIADPSGAVNHFMIFLIDLVYGVFPSTPTQYTVGALLQSFANQFPLLGWGSVYEIFNGMSVMFGLWCVVKLWQLLPFT